MAASAQLDFSESRPVFAAATASLVTPCGSFFVFESASTRLAISSTIFGTAALAGPQSSFALASACSASSFLAAAASFRLASAAVMAGAALSTPA